jgi:hypothetical protein
MTRQSRPPPASRPRVPGVPPGCGPAGGGAGRRPAGHCGITGPGGTGRAAPVPCMVVTACTFYCVRCNNHTLPMRDRDGIPRRYTVCRRVPAVLSPIVAALWRAGTRTATIENMIREAILLNRWAASPVRHALSSLRTARSWPRARALVRRLALAGQREAPASTDAPAAAQPAAKPRQLRPIVVPVSLDELHGPSFGLVTPPRRLWWSGEEGVAFDLSSRCQAAELYEAVLEAARTYRDITDHLDAGLLVELWPELGMRRATRQAWEAAHPVLAAATASSPAA